ncbi:alpha-2-macroglobulin [Pleionea sp. CnH1-48]|uniref:alpha-2-macroglobulin family protein n=1 Tax=Pleionea sp. CnH1-48 TaxID=2954494 RepID=UPI002097EED9|nr:alpha-2-macroglobulin family protein [Pleionea sp. CnH1-48]MCO7223300.1 hypothetical protein [Pleionea sp. CnH1-48]
MKKWGLALLLSLTACQSSVNITESSNAAESSSITNKYSWNSAISKNLESPVITQVYQDIDVNRANIEFTFSKDMQRNAAETIQYKTEPRVPCIWTWNDVRHLSCQIDEGAGLTPATLFKIDMLDGLYDQQGKKLAPYSYQFESPLPQIEHVETEWKSPVKPELLVAFNVGVDERSLKNRLYLQAPNGDKVLLSASKPQRLDTDYEGRIWGKNNQWLLKPTKALHSARTYTLFQSEGIATPYGKLKSKKRQLEDIHTYGDFEYKGAKCRNDTVCEPNRTLTLSFSAPVDQDDIKKCQKELEQQAVRVFLDRSYDDRKIIVAPEFANATKRLHCLESIRDVFGRQLDSGKPITVTAGDFPAFHYSPFASEAVTTDDELKLFHQSVNLSSIDIEYLEVDYKEVDIEQEYKHRKLTINDNRNKLVKSDLLTTELKSARSVAGVARIGSNPWQDRSFFVQKTDYNAIVTRNGNNTLVFITDIRTNQPVANMPFTVTFSRYYEGERLLSSAQGRTDKQGVTELAGFAPNFYSGDKSTLTFKLKNGDEFAIRGEHNVEPELQGDDSYKQKSDGEKVFWGVTDKPLYRPGDSIKFTGFLRKVDGAKTRITPLEKDALLYVEGADISCWSSHCDSFYVKRNIAMDNHGRISGEFKIPDNVADGYYMILLADSQFNDIVENYLEFQVANFKRQKLKVTAKPQIEGTLTKDELTVTTRAEYYSGGPYANVPASVALSMDSASFAESLENNLANYQDFIFTPNSSKQQEELSSYFFDGGTLNHSGESEVEIELPLNAINYGELTIQSIITNDEGIEVLSRLESVPFSRKPYYVGIKALDWWLPSGKELKLESRVADLAGELVPDVEVKYYTQKSNGFWSYDDDSENTEERKRLSCRASSKNGSKQEGRNTCFFTHNPSGYYQLIAEIVYPDGSRQYSFSTHYFSSGEQDTESNLVLKAENESLNIGDKAKLSLQHHLDDNASALVMIHRNEVFDYWWQPLQKGLNDISFTIKEHYAPGFDATVFVNYGDLDALKQLEAPNFAQAITQRFNVKVPSVAPLVTISRLTNTVKPGSSLAVQLTNHRDSSSSVVLAVIDESILNQVSNNEYYDVKQSYLGESALSWSPPNFYELSKSLYSSKFYEMAYSDTFDGKLMITGSRIRRQDLRLHEPVMTNDAFSVESSLEKGSSQRFKQIGSHRIDPSMIRSIFKESAYWNSEINLDGKQKKIVDIKLPDNLTRWKVIAISTGREGDIFTDTKEVAAAKDIELHADVPMQLTQGDHFVFQPEAITKTDDIHSLSITSAAELIPNKESPSKESPNKVLLKETAKSFDKVTKFERNKLEMTLSIAEEGKLDLLTLASSTIDNDALLQSVPIQSTEQTRRMSRFTLLPEEKVVEFTMPENYSTSRASIRFDLSQSLVSSLDGTFDYMRRYPHQCWEQKLSRALVASINLRSEEDVDKALLNTHIEDAIQSFGQFQASNGGMAFFGNSEAFVNDYLSAYTYKNIAYMSKYGYEFSESSIRKLSRYLIGQLKDKDKNMTLELAVIMVNALSVNSDNQAIVDAYLPSLVDAHQQLDVYSNSLLLEAVTRNAKYQQYESIIKNMLLNKTRKTDKKRTFIDDKKLPWYFFSYDAKKYCSAISALVSSKADKKTIFQLINGALDYKRNSQGDFGNTISNAYCSVAISDYAAEYESNTSALEYSLSLQQHDVSLDEANKNDEVAVSLKAPLTVAVKSEASATAYLASTLEYKVNAMEVPTTSNGFHLTRSYFKRVDGKWQVIDRHIIEQGDYVKVRLSIHNPLFRRYVALTDTLPGAFFALDEELATSAPAELFKQLQQDYYFREKQLGTRHARFYADYLPAGNHTVEYLVRVTHKGKFSALPALIEEMYDDDVFASSSAQMVLVH